MANQVYRPFLGKRVSPELEALIQKLNKMFGEELRISPVKPEDGIEPTDGIIIEWFGRVPKVLFRRLELEQNEIFGANQWNWQILCQWGPTQERGVQILCLDTPKKRLDCLWGFWYR
jgi:hypothetical protein